MTARTKLTTAVVGLGVSGMSCLRFLAPRDHLVVVDSRAQPASLERAQSDFPNARFFVGVDGADARRWQGVDRVVVSPGIAPDDALLAGSEALPRLSDIDLFVAATSAPVIAVTGTNGKSTVTALVGHMLREFGLQVGVGGNLGEPALDLLRADTDAYVLELSSFQIEHSGLLPLAAATVLNLSVDHMDRHGSMVEYGAIKRRIYTGAGFCVVNADDTQTHAGTNSHFCSFGSGHSADWGLSASGELQFQGATFASVEEFSLTGRHNMLNVLAAIALIAPTSSRIAKNLSGLPPFVANERRYVSAAASFKGLPHRAEFVREVAGVRYVNDSKATNVGASVAALAGFPKSCSARGDSPGVVLLAGGVGKDADFTPLGRAAAGRVKTALLFGEDAAGLERALSGQVPVELCAGFAVAVERARALATAGDTVLLAPACASFDMFANFMERGDRFRELVEAFA